jgi:hypothetical protein
MMGGHGGVTFLGLGKSSGRKEVLDVTSQHKAALDLPNLIEEPGVA